MQISIQDIHIKLPAWTARFLNQKAFYTTYLLLAIMLTTSAFYYYFAKNVITADGFKGSATDNKLYLLLWLGLYGITGLSFLFTLAQKGIYSSFFLVTPLILWVLFSFSWSVSSDRTLYFGVMLIMQVFIAYVVVENIRPEHFVKILTYTFSVFLLLSIVGFILMPEKTSLPRYGGGWLIDSEMNGIFSHKSDAGYFFALLIVLLMSTKDFGLRWPSFLRYSLVLLAMVGIILANSATALVSAIFLVGVYMVLPRVRNRERLLYVIGLVLLVFALAVPYIDIGQLATLVGRDPGLTGRGDIWRHGMTFMAEQPFIGYGYYGFFDQDIFSPVWKLWEQFEYFLTPHFHNSGLDIVISLGVIGLGLYVFVMMGSFVLLHNKTVPFAVRTVLFLILLLFIITSAFDFTLMKHNHFATFFLFYTFFLARKKCDYAD